jgi:hypothetical protein
MPSNITINLIGAKLEKRDAAGQSDISAGSTVELEDLSGGVGQVAMKMKDEVRRGIRGIEAPEAVFGAHGGVLGLGQL